MDLSGHTAEGGFQPQMKLTKVAAQLTLRPGCTLDHAGGSRNKVEGKLEERLRQKARSGVAEMEEEAMNQ